MILYSPYTRTNFIDKIPVNYLKFFIYISFFLIISLVLVFDTFSMQLHLSFAEVMQGGDLIFIGTVEKQVCRFANEKKSGVLTDVYFTNLIIIHSTERSVQKNLSTIHLIHAGGRVDGLAMVISDRPRFSDGHRYLLSVLDDKKAYAGGATVVSLQGIFEVIKDEVSKEEFVLTYGRRPVVGVNESGPLVGEKRVSKIHNGILFFEREAQDEPQFKKQVLKKQLSPTPMNPKDLVFEAPIKNNDQLPPMKLKEFIDYIRNVALKLPVERKIRKR